MKLKINIAFLSYQIGKNPKIWQYTVSETVRKWLPLYSAGRNPAPPVPIEVHLSVSNKIIDTFIYWLSSSMSRSLSPRYTGVCMCACMLSLICVRLFVTHWTGACQASLSFTISQSLLRLKSVESVMPSNHLVLCHPLLLLPSFLASGSFLMSRLMGKAKVILSFTLVIFKCIRSLNHVENKKVKLQALLH